MEFDYQAVLDSGAVEGGLAGQEQFSAEGTAEHLIEGEFGAIGEKAGSAGAAAACTALGAAGAAPVCGVVGGEVGRLIGDTFGKIFNSKKAERERRRRESEAHQAFIDSAMSPLSEANLIYFSAIEDLIAGVQSAQRKLSYTLGIPVYVATMDDIFAKLQEMNVPTGFAGYMEHLNLISSTHEPEKWARAVQTGVNTRLPHALDQLERVAQEIAVEMSAKSGAITGMLEAGTLADVDEVDVISIPGKSIPSHAKIETNGHGVGDYSVSEYELEAERRGRDQTRDERLDHDISQSAARKKELADKEMGRGGSSALGLVLVAGGLGLGAWLWLRRQ